LYWRGYGWAFLRSTWCWRKPACHVIRSGRTTRSEPGGYCPWSC